MRVLLIVPHPVLARALARGLAEEGWAVTAAPSREAGDREARAGGHDAIILDTKRAGEDDLALLGRWRRVGLRAPVLALTTAGGGPGGGSPFAGVADASLAKPFAWDELLARLRRLTRRRGRPALSPAVPCP